MTSDKSINLIINADDYGYFDCVSRGIIDAANSGVVTATGILANSAGFERSLPYLSQTQSLDLGVHLNLTYGYPLSKSLSNTLSRWQGRFPPKFDMAIGILTGKINSDLIQSEFQMQVEKCLEKGITLTFLNSHEHLHMLPPLYKLTVSLAREYQIPFVRYPDAEWIGKLGVGSVLRNCVFGFLNTMNRSRKPGNTPKLIGMSESGNLSIEYLEKRFRTLESGTTYELMCHPGHFDSSEITDNALINYHYWDSEYDLLTGDAFKELCAENSIKIVGYRDIV